MLDGVVGMDHRKTSLKANIKLGKKKKLSFFLLKKPNVTLPFFVCQTHESSLLSDMEYRGRFDYYKEALIFIVLIVHDFTNCLVWEAKPPKVWEV